MDKLESYLYLIKDLTTKFNFEKFKIINPLESNKTEIFLLGLPKSGKTTFLNAILGLERNEFYESTKKATKCIFKICFGDSYSFKRENGEIKLMPKTIDARRDLIRYLNESDSFVEIFIPNNFLKKINFYDFPGLFSGDETDENIKYAIQASDLIILFKNASDMLTPEEKNLLINAKNYGTQYFIVFTFEDLLDRELKRNKIELENYFERKISEYPEIPVYFLISSEEYFKNNKGNICDVKNYITENSEIFKANSIKEKVRVSARHYFELLNTRLTELKSIINSEKENVIRIHEIEINRKILELKDNLNNYLYDAKDLKEQMIYEFNKELDSGRKTHILLQNIWEKYLSLLNSRLKKIRSSFELKELPHLPEYDEIILNPYDISEILSRLENILIQDGNSELDKIFNRFLNKPLGRKDNNKVSNFLKEILEIIDIPKLKDEVLNFIDYLSERNRFLDRCEIIYGNLISSAVSQIEKYNSIKINELMEHKGKTLKEIETELSVKFNISEINEYISKLKVYICE